MILGLGKFLWWQTSKRPSGFAEIAKRAAFRNPQLQIRCQPLVDGGEYFRCLMSPTQGQAIVTRRDVTSHSDI